MKKEYEIKLKPGFCGCCGYRSDTRIGFCFDCVECESVISEGLDMYDKPISKLKGYSTHMSKLRFILEKYRVKKTDA